MPNKDLVEEKILNVHVGEKKFAKMYRKIKDTSKLKLFDSLDLICLKISLISVTLSSSLSLSLSFFKYNRGC